MAFEMGVDVDTWTVDVAASLAFSTDRSYNRWLVKLTQSFYTMGFDLPVEVWAPYLRVDADPAEITRLMRSLFGSASWPMRRRLAAGNPWPLARSLRP